MAEIRKIEPVIRKPEARKKVAAYARVSMDTERLHHSLSAQVSYYSKLIQNNPEWEYAGVYADEGISGTGTAKRKAFNRMITDCEAGKINIILTKSISRFARNTVDLLETVRHLKDLGIEVRFEKEGINSLSGDGEVMLTLLASFAQEESISISNNVKWGIRKRMQKGLPYATGHTHVYGYRWEGDELVIVPKEAAVVKRIYQNFLDGKSRLETERELADEGIRTRAGNRWNDSNLRVILTNVTYTGNMLFQKEYISDPITKKTKKNRGELPKYFVENTHPAIIDKETFDYVQKEMARRKALGCFANKALNLNCFSTKIKCGCCGRSFVRSRRKNKAKQSALGEYEVLWECTSHKKKKHPGQETCTSGIIRESVLQEETAKVLEIPEFDADVFSEKIKQIIVPEKGILIFEFRDGTRLEHHWSRSFRKDAWTEDLRKQASEYRRTHAARGKKGTTCFTTKIRCEDCGHNYHKQNVTMADGRRNGYWHCSNRKNCNGKSLREDHLKEITAEVLGTDSFSEEEFLEQIDYISVRNATHLTFHFNDGHTVKREYTFKKEGTPHTKEYKEYMSQIMKERRNTPEYRRIASERMKKIRSEKFWSSRRK